MKAISILSVLGLIILFGCLDGGQDKTYSYKGVDIPIEAIPDYCEGLEDCEMFACLVENCWCSEIPPQSGVIYLSSKNAIDEESAKAVLIEYLNSASVNYEEETIRVVKLNEIFYNAFYDVEGNEEVLTVGVDGTVMSTVCGV